MKARILLVDDEPAVRFGPRRYLEAEGYEVVEAGSCREAEEVFANSDVDLAIVDYRLADGDALTLLPRLRSRYDVPVLILTAHGSIDLAVRAMQLGAETFLTKPVALPALAVIIERSLTKQREHRSLEAKKVRGERDAVDPFVGTSTAIERLRRQCERVAPSGVPVLLLGETGTGKGVLARWLHDHGRRSGEAFVDVNCAGLDQQLLESELFGHEKGAFTGAVTRKRGLLEVAHRGTLFLDEIGDLGPAVQGKLLKVLEEKRFRRLGGVEEQRVDVRLITATNRDLERLAREGAFRPDLLFRLDTVVLRLPSLAERPEDLAELARGLVRRLGAEAGLSGVDLDEGALAAIRAHAWPGNVRQLRNTLDRALLFAGESGRRLRAADLFPDGERTGDRLPPDTDATLAEVERRHILAVLAEEGGALAATARRLGIHRSTLHQKLRRYGVATSRIAT